MLERAYARNDGRGLVGCDRQNAQRAVPSGCECRCLFRFSDRASRAAMTKYFIVTALGTVALFGQSQGSSSLQGFVRDSQGQPVGAATVQLKISGETFTALTDAQGTYRFGPL